MTINSFIIQTTLEYLQELKRRCDNNEKVCSNKLADDYRLSHTIFTNAVKLKYFSKINTKYYKCNISAFEPVHARKLILENRKYSKAMKIKREQETKNATISSDRIQKMLQFLIEMKYCVDNGFPINHLTRKYHISDHYPSTAIKLNYFEKTESDIKCNINSFQKSHAEALIRAEKKYITERKKIREDIDITNENLTSNQINESKANKNGNIKEYEDDELLKELKERGYIFKEVLKKIKL